MRRHNQYVAKQSSRRSFVQRSLAALFAGLAAPTAGLSGTHTQHYRIDVTVAPFGIPIFSRREVGYGLGRLQAVDTDGGRRVHFEFGGASIPERAHGLRQIGYFEETLTQSSLGLDESRYFGFLSTAPEGPPSKTMLASAKADAVTAQKCCVVEGAVRGGLASFSKSYDAQLPAGAGFQSIPDLRSSLKLALGKLCAQGCLAGSSQPARPHTFLSTLLDASFSKQANFHQDYIYGDRTLRFTSERKSSDGHCVIDAQVRGRGRHQFRFSSAGAGEYRLPAKIEYFPRAWLRLTLEAVSERGLA